MPAIRVLLVHDDPDCRRIYEAVLRHEGFEVASLSDGDAAMARLASEPFDLVVTDLFVEGLGDECFPARIRAEPGLAGTRMVVVSAWTSEDHRRLAVYLGAEAFVPLPASPQEVLGVVRWAATDASERAPLSPGVRAGMTSLSVAASRPPTIEMRC